MELDYYRKLKNVDRLQTTPKQREYNLAEHSFYVTVFFRHFASKEDIAYDMVTLDYVMHHDILESVTSDLLYPIKNLNGTTQECWDTIETEVLKKHHQLERYSAKNMKETLSKSQFDLFKACDLLDLWIFLKEEQALGNNSKQAIEVIANCERLIDDKFEFIIDYMKEAKF